MIEWGYTAAGLFVGLLVGLTGVGGGSLMTPLLIFLFHINPAVAVGTDLLFAAITKASGIWVHSRKKNVDWNIVGLLALGSLPMALVSLVIIDNFKTETETLSTIITVLLGVALVLTAASLLMRRQMHRFGEKIKVLMPSWREKRPYATVAAGAVLGILVPITSVGAGALGAAILMFLYPSMPMRRIVGTDLAHAVPLTLIAGLGHLHIGTVDLTLLVALLLGSLPGIYIGSHMSTIVPEKIMRPLLASMLLLIGFKFMFA